MKQFYSNPQAYFLTFTTYGTWLHGDARLSVDRKNNIFCEKRISHSKIIYHSMMKKTKGKSIILDSRKRMIILDSIKQAVQYYDWELFAAHVRSNHVHLLLRADEAPEIVLRKIKANATRNLNFFYEKEEFQKYWTKHGSTRYVWTEKSLHSVMRYIVEGQGEKMACFYQSWFDKDVFQNNCRSR